MRLNLTLSKKALILVSVPLVFELAFVGALAYLLQQSEVERQREAHARDVTAQINTALRILLDGGTASVIGHLSGSNEARKRYRRSLGAFPVEMRRLFAMVQDNPAERQALQRMQVLFNETMFALQEAGDRLAEGDRMGSMKPWSKMQKSLNELFIVSEDIIQKQEAIQQERRLAQANTREQLKWLIIIGVIFNIVLAVCLAAYFNEGTARRFAVLIQNTLLFAAGKPLKPALTGGDEIAHLDSVFRSMAQTLETTMKKQQAIVDNAADVICSIDSDGRFSAVNPAAARVWGFQPQELLGTRLVQIVAPDDFQSTRDKINKATHDKVEISFDNQVIRKDGTAADMMWSIYWSEQEQSLFCVVHDITAQKEIDKLKRDFVAMVSHDLKTPLTSVQGFLSVLSTGTYNQLSQSGIESLNMAESSVTRLITLVNDLLDIERMESGRFELKLAPGTVSGLIEEAEKSVAHFAAEHKVEIRAGSGSDIEFVGDTDRLVQVMVNLLSNAIKFSKEDDHVSIDAVEDDNDVKIMVRDNGRGVPDSLKSSIFDRFKQVEMDDQRIKKGSGLGLAISKAIIERHGGTIGVEDNSNNGEPAGGSVFWFTIPKHTSV